SELNEASERGVKTKLLLFKAVGSCLEQLKLLELLEKKQKSDRNDSDEEVYVFFYKGENFYKLEGKDLKKIERRWQLVEEFGYYIPRWTQKEQFLDAERSDLCGEKRFLLGFKLKKKVVL
ncbi:MAG: hypothetical protein HQK53_19735, partial [Oligoflexia bacterium]|nr:hypothetical protein [Oligoflexia bacterium]